MKKIALLCLLLSPLSHADNIRDDQTNISYRYSDSTIGLELHKIYYNSGFILDYKLGGSLRHDIDTQQDYGFFALMGGKGYGRHAPNEFFLGVEFGIDKVGKGAIGKRLMESLSETNESVYRHARQSQLPKNFPLAAYAY